MRNLHPFTLSICFVEKRQIHWMCLLANSWTTRKNRSLHQDPGTFLQKICCLQTTEFTFSFVEGQYFDRDGNEDLRLEICIVSDPNLGQDPQGDPSLLAGLEPDQSLVVLPQGKDLFHPDQGQDLVPDLQIDQDHQ
jgi:hypothetical protein